ncbi:MAG: hypothetical protein ABIQ16_14815 [Polyangiaceae bacterium]
MARRGPRPGALLLAAEIRHHGVEQDYAHVSRALLQFLNGTPAADGQHYNATTASFDYVNVKNTKKIERLVFGDR